MTPICVGANLEKRVYNESIGMTIKKDAVQRYTKHEDFVVEQLADPKDAELYLQLALDEYEEDGDTEAFLLSLSSVAKAQGGFTELARRTGLSRQSLYKALSPEGNPRLDTLGNVLHAMGFKLSVSRRESKI